jgi:hypothetical protein
VHHVITKFLLLFVIFRAFCHFQHFKQRREVPFLQHSWWDAAVVAVLSHTKKRQEEIIVASP